MQERIQMELKQINQKLAELQQKPKIEVKENASKDDKPVTD
jgi:hypothetical protein